MQTLVPIATISAGGWTSSLGGPLSDAIDEPTRNDADYIQSIDQPTGDICELKLSPATLPLTGSQINYAAGSSGDPLSVRVELRCGAVVIATWYHASLTTLTGFAQALSSSQAAAITDPTDLRLRFRADQANAGAGNIFQVGFNEIATITALTDYDRPIVRSDFDTRKIAPGVVRWWDFDTVAQLGPNAITNPGQSYADPVGVTPATTGPQIGVRIPVIDTNFKCSGLASLRFDVSPGPGPAGDPNNNGDSCGAWFGSFSDDLLTQFGPGEEFFVQFRTYMSQSLYDQVYMSKTWNVLGPATRTSPTTVTCTGASDHFTVYGSLVIRTRSATPNAYTYGLILSKSWSAGVWTISVQVLNGTALDPALTNLDSGYLQGGLKVFDVTGGNVPGGPQQYSSGNLKCVIQSYAQTQAIQVYSYGVPYRTINLHEAIAGGDAWMQNQMPTQQCTVVAADIAAGHQITGPLTGCWNRLPEQWETYQIGVQIIDRVAEAGGGSSFNYRVRLWAMHENDPASTLLLDYGPSTPGYARMLASDSGFGLEYGKVWFFPYFTGLDASQAFNPGHVWFDECIVSTQKIADPAPSTGGGATNPILMAIAPGSSLDLGIFNLQAPPDHISGYYRMWEFGGFTFDPYGRQILSAGGGGHGTTLRDDITAFSLNTLTWTSLIPSTLASAMTQANADLTHAYWIANKHPRGRHNYSGQCVLQDANGRTRLYMVTPSAAVMQDFDATWGQLATGPNQLSGFDFADGTWHPALSFACPWQDVSACAVDPMSKKIVVFAPIVGPGASRIWLYDPVAETAIASSASYSGFFTATTTALVYSSAKDRFYYFDPDSSSPFAVNRVYEIAIDRANPAASTATLLTGITGTPPSGLNAEYAFAYNASNGKIGGAFGGGNMHTFDPATKTWATVSTGIPSAQTSDIMHCVAFDPVNGVYLVLTTAERIDYHMYAFRP